MTTSLLGPTAPLPFAEPDSARIRHPLVGIVVRRLPLALLSIIAVSVIVYAATLVMPGDAASSILGQQATPERLAALRLQLGLDQPAWAGYWSWLTHFVQGDFGTSLTQNRSVGSLMSPRLVNSAVLVVLASIASTVLGVVFGAIAAARRDKLADHVMSGLALVASALPEFIVGVLVVLLLTVLIATGLPALSLLPQGATILDAPEKMVLPLITLVIVTTPYVFRMTRAATIDALNSDYSEVALLKGVSPRRLIFRHALPNALAPVIQVVGLNLLYLAGGIVLVETVFQYPGVGLSLVAAVTSRDVPVIQFLTVLLSILYVVLNIVTDVAVLLVTPRKRYPR